MGALRATAIGCLLQLLALASAGVANHHEPILSGALLARRLNTPAEALTLSRTVLEPATTNSEAVARAQALHAALQSDRTGVLHNLFVAWSTHHGREYSDMTEVQHALTSFSTSVDATLQHNLGAQEGHWRGLVTVTFKLPKTLRITRYSKSTTSGGSSTGFTQKNWAADGYTTPVKDQGPSDCSSAWVNAALSAIESNYAIAMDSGPPPSLSRQAALDCINGETAPGFERDEGCDGGYVEDVFWFVANYTIPVETAYPYSSGSTGVVGRCRTEFMNLMEQDDTGPNAVHWTRGRTSRGEPLMEVLVDHTAYSIYLKVSSRPVVVFWNANSRTATPGGGLDEQFMTYEGGVYNGSGCSTNVTTLNHVMLLVGYDKLSQPPVWILQNSFSADWGEQGFMRVLMVDDNVGTCGMYQLILAPSMLFIGNLPSDANNETDPSENWQPPDRNVGGGAPMNPQLATASPPPSPRPRPPPSPPPPKAPPPRRSPPRPKLATPQPLKALPVPVIRPSPIPRPSPRPAPSPPRTLTPSHATPTPHSGRTPLPSPRASLKPMPKPIAMPKPPNGLPRPSPGRTVLPPTARLPAFNPPKATPIPVPKARVPLAKSPSPKTGTPASVGKPSPPSRRSPATTRQPPPKASMQSPAR